jgi:hypothetical protein
VRKSKNMEIGKAAELRVASELLLRGCRVLLSIVDTGIDLVTEKGQNVQIKCASASSCKPSKPKNRYVFSFRRWVVHKKGERKQVLSGAEETVDFVVLWCLQNNFFFVLPKGAMKNTRTLNIYFNHGIKPAWLIPYKDNWSLITEGGDA